jgi:transcriptional regulator NrdR family protein
MTDAIGCPECLATATRVVDSRPSYDRGSVCRRRECVTCGCRWTTYEIDKDRLDLLEDCIRPQAKEQGPGS